MTRIAASRTSRTRIPAANRESSANPIASRPRALTERGTAFHAHIERRTDELAAAVGQPAVHLAAVQVESGVGEVVAAKGLVQILVLQRLGQWEALGVERHQHLCT